MSNVNIPPITGNEELDQWTTEAAEALNSGELGGGGGDVVSGLDDQARPTLGDVVLGYQEQYLDTVYGTSATGTNLTQTVAGLPDGWTEAWQGVRNTDTALGSTNPLDFTWRLTSLDNTAITPHTGTWFDLPASPTMGDQLAVTDFLIPYFYAGTQKPAPVINPTSGSSGSGPFWTFWLEATYDSGNLPAVSGNGGTQNITANDATDWNDATSAYLSDGFEFSTLAQQVVDQFIQISAGNTEFDALVPVAAAAIAVADLTVDYFVYKAPVTGTLTFDGTDWVFSAGAASQDAFYLLLGNRNIDWFFGTTAPTSNWTTDSGPVIDLEDLTISTSTGQQGDPGVSSRLDVAYASGAGVEEVQSMVWTGTQSNFVGSIEEPNDTATDYWGRRDDSSGASGYTELRDDDGNRAPNNTYGQVVGTNITNLFWNGQEIELPVALLPRNQVLYNDPNSDYTYRFDAISAGNRMLSFVVGGLASDLFGIRRELTAATVSTYNVRDPAGILVGAVTGSRTTLAEEDDEAIAALVASSITTSSADVSAVVDNATNTITITYSTTGDVAGVWSVDTTHSATASIAGDIAFADATVTTGGQGFSSLSFPSGTFTDDDYTLADPTDATLIGVNSIRWSQAEPEPSQDSADYAFSQYGGVPGATGAGGVSVFVTTSDGTVFRNNAGSNKQLTANVNLGGIIPSATDYAGYHYNWTYNGDTVYVDSGRNVLSTNGIPATTNALGGDPANSEVTTTVGDLRSIFVDPTDVNLQLRLAVEVSNIPD